MASPVEQVLEEMDAVVNRNVVISHQVASWLAVLRPALARRQAVIHHALLDMPEPPGTPDGPMSTERWNLSSNLNQQQLRDMHITIQLSTDHEGGGAIELDYHQVPPQHRLQGLIQLMGAIGTRIELAIGRDPYTNMLRGVVARREREE